jgi:hypothetical protein
MVSRIGRRITAAVNPVSGALIRRWRWSAVRRVLTGRGPTRQDRLSLRQGRGFGVTASAAQMQARRAAIDELMRRDNPEV